MTSATQLEVCIATAVKAKLELNVEEPPSMWEGSAKVKLPVVNLGRLDRYEREKEKLPKDLDKNDLKSVVEYNRAQILGLKLGAHYYVRVDDMELAKFTRVDQKHWSYKLGSGGCFVTAHLNLTQLQHLLRLSETLVQHNDSAEE